MTLAVNKMTRDFAIAILNWKYEPPYDFYNNSVNDEAIEELMNNPYLAVVNEQMELVGFFCTGDSARVPSGYAAGAYPGKQLDIGIGMKPELTGQGFGSVFFPFILNHIKGNTTLPLRLTVATFNKRAIRLYERFGFVKKLQFSHRQTEFMTMVRNNEGQIVD